MAEATPVATPFGIAVAGNPNAGKTTLFNALTGLRQKVANYPGVTVDVHQGTTTINGQPARLLDLPGAYSLSAQSPDEEVARDVLLGWQMGDDPPDAVLIVVDASHLDRNLYLATQILELGHPAVIALTMIDLLADRGAELNLAALEEDLGTRVIAVNCRSGVGLDELRTALAHAQPARRRIALRPPVEAAVDRLAAAVETHGARSADRSFGIALRLLSAATGTHDARRHYGPGLAAAVEAERAALTAEGIAWQGFEASARYAWLRRLMAEVLPADSGGQVRTRSDRLDRWLTHRVWGPVFFLLVMAVVFQSIYAWAEPLMGAIEGAVAAFGAWLDSVLPPGPLSDLLVEGVVAGVGAVIVFIPQIGFLFAFLSLLESSGYMARAAFVMDRVMRRVGLHGRSFVPLLSSFACTVPGIMAARTIGNRRDRLTTILVAPLITCSARLPVYALLIGAFVPPTRVLGGLLNLQGLVLLGLYLTGTLSALGIAALLKQTVLRSATPSLVLELPRYHWPDGRAVLLEVADRLVVFLRFAGTIILSMSILLWFLATYPRTTGDANDQAQASYLGQAGRAIEPLIEPLGFDWRIGVSLISAVAAREAVVSTLGVLFEVDPPATDVEAPSDAADTAEAADPTLASRLRAATWPDGRPLFTLPTVIAMLLFVAFACQCMSTIGVVARETGGWRWPTVLFLYTNALAYTLAWLAQHGLSAAGMGG